MPLHPSVRYSDQMATDHSWPPGDVGNMSQTPNISRQHRRTAIDPKRKFKGAKEDDRY